MGPLLVAALAAAATSLTALHRHAAVAQVTVEAKCAGLANFSAIAVNSLGQSPCVVAAYLQSVCSEGKWDTPPLLFNQHYSPPNAPGANQCECSTVTYSALSACAGCQGQLDAWENWSIWKSNCTIAETTIAGYPLPIPVAINVPGWAYLDVTQDDTFNLTSAVAAANLPEHTGGSTTSSSSTSSGSTSTSGVVQPTGTGKKSTPIGAIVGGVVGGLFVIGLITIVAVWAIMRKRRSQAPAAAYSGPGPQSPFLTGNAYAPTQPFSPGSQPSFPTGTSNGYAPTQMSQHLGQPPVLYNPDDPSTWPSSISPAPTGATGQSIHTTYGHSAYTGAPEL